MTQLMTFAEMQDRYQNKEDPFVLTTEKWARIRQFADTARTSSDFQELLQATNIAVPFCFQYQRRNCLGCPLESLCGPGRGEKLFKVMKVVQTHYLAILAGNTLSKGPLIAEIEQFMGELQKLRPEEQ